MVVCLFISYKLLPDLMIIYQLLIVNCLTIHQYFCCPDYHKIIIFELVIEWGTFISENHFSLELQKLFDVLT